MPNALYDPARIEPMLQALRDAWYQRPEMRLCQLIVNVTSQQDPFYVDDKELRDKLREYPGV